MQYRHHKKGFRSAIHTFDKKQVKANEVFTIDLFTFLNYVLVSFSFDTARLLTNQFLRLKNHLP